MTFIRTARMSPTFSFSLRTKRDTGEAMIYLRLRFDGHITQLYKTYITVPVEIWPHLPEDDPQSTIVALQMNQLKADHKWLAVNLPNPTAESIKAAWLDGRGKKEKVEKFATLTETYQAHLDYLTTPPKRKNASWRPPAEKTMTNRGSVGKHLKDFLGESRLTYLRLDALRVSHGYRFADYMFDLGLNADTVGRYINYLGKSIEHAMRYDDRIAVNPIDSVKIKGEPAKRIDYIKEVDLIKLAAIELNGIYDTVRNWALLECYTGLDHKDAIYVSKNLDKCYRVGPDGDTIVFQRLKFNHAPAWGECHIPVMPMTRELLKDMPKWKRVRLKVMNTHLKKIGPKIGLTFELHTKIFRKSAGVMMLLYYEDIYLVQKAMGHQSIETTQAFYVALPPEVVHKAMKKRSEADEIKAKQEAKPDNYSSGSGSS